MQCVDETAIYRLQHCCLLTATNVTTKEVIMTWSWQSSQAWHFCLVCLWKFFSYFELSCIHTHTHTHTPVHIVTQVHNYQYTDITLTYTLGPRLTSSSAFCRMFQCSVCIQVHYHRCFFGSICYLCFTSYVWQLRNSLLTLRHISISYQTVRLHCTEAHYVEMILIGCCFTYLSHNPSDTQTTQ